MKEYTKGARVAPSPVNRAKCGVRVGEALQIEWSQVNLDARLIRLEEDQTKNAEARTVPLPSVLDMLLCEIEPKLGRVFTGRNLRTEWQKVARLAD